MNTAAPYEREVGAAFPGPLVRALLWFLLPSDRREEFEGDLIEEAEGIVLPRSGRKAALRWLWWQVATSVPSLAARRLSKEVVMYPQRWTVPAALLLIWGLWGLLDMGRTPDGGFDWGNSTVLSVDAGGPANRAGLEEGDRIISMDGIPPSDLTALYAQPRTEVGDTRVLVVERTDPASGETSTRNIEITYEAVPGGKQVVDYVGAAIGLVFLLTGLLVFLKAPSTPSFLFAVVGFGFAGILFPSPYIGVITVSHILSNLFFLVFLAAFAALLHLLLVYPSRKKLMETKHVRWLIYLPVVAFALLGLSSVLLDLPLSSLAPFGAIFLGIILLSYLVLSIVALVHSFVTAAPRERTETGLNLMLGGVLVGVVPLIFRLVAGLFARTDLIPGYQFLFLTLILIPISFGAALLRGAKHSLPEPGIQPG